MTFCIKPLPADAFASLFGLSDTALAAAGVTPMVADAKPGFPCRVALRDGGAAATPQPIELPEAMRARLLSVRAFTSDAGMTNADVVEGRDAPALFEAMLADPEVSYLHAHYARRDCFAARIERS